MKYLAVLGIIFVLASFAQADNAVITPFAVSSPQEVQDLESKYPEIKDSIRDFQLKTKTRVLGILNLKGMVVAVDIPSYSEDSYFSDGECGTKVFGTASVLLVDNKQTSIEFYHIDYKNCVFPYPLSH